jgi:catechol 2,3-dioxygenase-like lactoylglutathione lyase family enzyme
MTGPDFPALQQVVLDSTDARPLADFYRELPGYRYRGGDEPPPAGADDPQGRDWLVLAHPSGAPRLAFQQVAELPRSTWPGTGMPQQLHLDLTVPDIASLRAQQARALSLGARLLLDRSDDPVEPLFVDADPEGHPFCIFAAVAMHGLRWAAGETEVDRPARRSGIMWARRVEEHEWQPRRAASSPQRRVHR